MTVGNLRAAFLVGLIEASVLMKKRSPSLILLFAFGCSSAIAAPKICPPKTFPLMSSNGYRPSPLIRLSNPPSEAITLRELLGHDELPVPDQAWFRTKSGLLVLYQGHAGRGHLTGFFKTGSGWRVLDVGELIDCKGVS